jgi:hypothetical protein
MTLFCNLRSDWFICRRFIPIANRMIGNRRQKNNIRSAFTADKAFPVPPWPELTNEKTGIKKPVSDRFSTCG